MGLIFAHPLSAAFLLIALFMHLVVITVKVLQADLQMWTGNEGQYTGSLVPHAAVCRKEARGMSST